MADEKRLCMYCNGTDTVIAYSPSDACEVWTKSYGADYGEETGLVNDDQGWEEVSGDTVYTLTYTDEEPTRKVEQSAELWIAQEGRGFLGSTEF